MNHRGPSNKNIDVGFDEKQNVYAYAIELLCESHLLCLHLLFLADQISLHLAILIMDNFNTQI